VHPHQPGGAHQPGDALAATAHVGTGELGMDARRAVGATGPFVDLDDQGAQRSVAHRSRRWRPGSPRVEPGPGDTKDPAEPLDGELASVVTDESVAADRIVSWAK